MAPVLADLFPSIQQRLKVLGSFAGVAALLVAISATHAETIITHPYQGVIYI